MLKNVPIGKLIKILFILQRKGPLCNIEIRSNPDVISISAVSDQSALESEIDVKIPIDPNLKLNSDDLDKYIS